MPDPLLLLVEDNVDDVALAERALVRGGVRAELKVARNGKEAWTLLSSLLPGAARPVFLPRWPAPKPTPRPTSTSLNAVPKC